MTAMRVLFADAFPAEFIPAVEALGYAVDLQPELTAEDLPGAIGVADVLVVRSTPVTAAAIEAAGPLGMVLRAGAGTNTIDTHAAAARGIYVSNVPGKNAVAVAELAMGLILSLDRRIPDNVADARAGTWSKKAYGAAAGVAGRTLGIVGMGQIGMALAERAAAFEMPVITTAKERSPDITGRMEACGVATVATIEELAVAADILSFHVPGGDGTKGMVNADLLAHVRPGSWIINTSRGEIVDEIALLEAVEHKGLRVGLDVFVGEPKGGEGEFTSTLAQHPSVYTTHHIGASTAQAQRAVARGVIDVLAAFAEGEAVNVVNLTGPEPVDGVLVVRHFDRVGALSSVLESVREAGLNVQGMVNEPFSGAGAAVATIKVVGELNEQLRRRLCALADVIHCSIRVGT